MLRGILLGAASFIVSIILYWTWWRATHIPRGTVATSFDIRMLTPTVKFFAGTVIGYALVASAIVGGIFGIRSVLLHHASKMVQ